MYRLFLSFLILTLAASASTQSVKEISMPRVSMIGENEEEYEATVLECQSLLLNVCENSMSQAYDKWMVMLSDMEGFADQNGFDLKGLKIWINVFWNANGTIKHIVYYPKPNSKNMDFEDLTTFFYAFSGSYQLDLEHVNCYSHYGSATFPTFARRVGNQEK